MQNGKPTDRLIRFIEHVRSTRGGNVRPLTVLDVRLECRAQRLAEYADWPTNELDLIEHEAASYGDEADLGQVLSGTVHPTSIESGAWLHSPSAVAWT